MEQEADVEGTLEVLHVGAQRPENFVKVIEEELARAR